MSCLLTKVESDLGFKPFFFLEECLIYDFDPDSIRKHTEQDLFENASNHVGYISKLISECNKQGLKTQVMPSGSTRVRDVQNLLLNKVMIYRDMPRCDHMIMFTNLYTDPQLSLLLAFETRVNKVLKGLYEQ